MTLFDYLDRHPWRALMFLLVIVGGAVAVMEKRR